MRQPKSAKGKPVRALLNRESGVIKCVMMKTDSSTPIPVLLDTDIGSDIDDAVCLSYLLRQPQCELLGITTVTGEPQKRAALADAVCRAAGRTDIPIHSGTDAPLLVRPRQTHCPQANILPRFPHRNPEEFPPNTAVDFLRQQINARPGEITLLAIGPMTNLGLLFALDPEIPRKLKRLVLMCGMFFHQNPILWPCHNEWNAKLDPHATAMVYRAMVADHLSVGIDVTTRCKMPSDLCVQKFRDIGGPLAVVAAATEIWGSDHKTVTFHDPLTAAAIFNPSLCQYAEGEVTVELLSSNEQILGATLFDANVPQKPHRIAVDVDPEQFLAEYFAVVGAETKQGAQ